jgi:hypothetical protein
VLQFVHHILNNRPYLNVARVYARLVAAEVAGVWCLFAGSARSVRMSTA